jgi:site-specific recombinase XerD
VTPIVVAAYIKFLRESKSERPRVDRSKPTVKQALSALRRLFDYLVVDHVMEVNPALSVRGPKHVVTTGKTSHLEPEQMRQLFASIDSSTLIGLRDRALIAIMAYGFARVGAVVAMRVEDYFQMGKRWHFRLHEKNSKVLAMPAHHTAEEFVDAYLNAVGIGWEKKSPLFRSMTRWGRVNRTAMTENDAYRMVKKRAKAAGLPYTTKNHTFRTTSCTTYLANGGKLEKAQQMMGHSDPRTTKLYDHTDDKLTLDEVEKIAY